MDDRAGHPNLRKCFEAFNQLPKPRPKGDLQAILDEIRELAKFVRFKDDDVRRIYSMAVELLARGEEYTLEMAFHFIRDLISAFSLEPTREMIDHDGPIFKDFLEFYFREVFFYSRDPRICTAAARHAASYCEPENDYRRYALGAFKMVWFNEYSQEKLDNEALKHLLFIASQKIRCNTNADPLLPHLVNFLDKVCYRGATCGLVIRVCQVLINFYEILKFSYQTELFSNLSSSLVFRWILSHAHGCLKTKCWFEVAKFLETSFSCAEFETNDILVRQNVFPLVNQMLKNGRPLVCAQLLKVVEAACLGPNFPYIDEVISNNLILSVVPSLSRSDLQGELQKNAKRAFGAYLGAVASRGSLKVAINDLIAASSKLLSLRYEITAFEAASIVSTLIELLEQEGDWNEYRTHIKERIGVQGFEMLLQHPSQRFRTLTSLIHLQLHGAREQLAPLDTGRGQEERRLA